MIYGIKTTEFDIQYIESKVSNPLLKEKHCHGQFELIAVLNGDISIMLEDKSYSLKENQTIIIPPLCYHSITTNENSAYHRITVLFSSDAIPDVIKDSFINKSSGVIIFASSGIEKMKHACQKNEQAIYIPLAKSLMIGMFYDALNAKSDFIEPKTDEFLEKIVMYIDRNLHKKILLDDIAKHTSRSKSSVCHIFEEKMNISPKQYILQKKLALANKLINEGTPPTVAAMQIGYDNYCDFYRIYRKNFGKKPSQR